jgi:hypothetical protein
MVMVLIKISVFHFNKKLRHETSNFSQDFRRWWGFGMVMSPLWSYNLNGWSSRTRLQVRKLLESVDMEGFPMTKKWGSLPLVVYISLCYSFECMDLYLRRWLRGEKVSWICEGLKYAKCPQSVSKFFFREKRQITSPAYQITRTTDVP